MSNFTAWRSLVDGEEVGGIPDSAVWQINAQELTGLSDQDTINTWPDVIGSNDLDQGTGLTYVTDGINGKPSARADGVDDRLFRDPFGLDISQKAVIFAVVELLSTASDFQIPHAGATGSDSTAYQLRLENSDGSAKEIFSGNSVSGGSVETTAVLVTQVYDGANSKIRENGTQTGTGDVGDRNQASGAEFNVGADREGERHANADIGMIEIHDGDVDGGITSREQEIADMWDITL